MVPAGDIRAPPGTCFSSDHFSFVPNYLKKSELHRTHSPEGCRASTVVKTNRGKCFISVSYLLMSF